MAELQSKEFARRIAEAADKIWEVGKHWEHDYVFSHDMKALSGKLHDIRREFESSRALSSVAESECSKISKIGAEVLREARCTGGGCGKLLHEAYDIIVGLVEDLRTVE